jgi:hypothetical protein
MVAVVIFFTYSLAIWISRGGEFVDALKDASAKGDLEVGLPEEVLIDVPENWRSMVYSLKIFSEMSLMKMFSKIMFFPRMFLMMNSLRMVLKDVLAEEDIVDVPAENVLVPNPR